MLSSEDGDDSHSYWYAHNLEIFHMSVPHVGPQSKLLQPQHMEFMTIWWFASKPDGWKTQWLYRVDFISADSSPFSFVDPQKLFKQYISFLHLLTLRQLTCWIHQKSHNPGLLMVFRSLHQLLNIENHLDDTMEVDEEPKGELNEMGQDHHGSEVFSQADEEGELPD